MTVFQKPTSRKIDIVFVFALFALFTAVSFSLIFIGTKQYHHITKTTNQNYLERTISSYLAEKIRQGDSQNAITISDSIGVPALCIRMHEGDYAYTNYIYCYEGTLRELVATNNSSFSLSSGQTIMEIKNFEANFIQDNLLCTSITHTNGEMQTLFFNIHCAADKEEL